MQLLITLLHRIRSLKQCVGVHEWGTALTVVFDEADFLLAGARASGGKSAGVSPAAKIVDSLRRSTKLAQVSRKQPLLLPPPEAVPGRASDWLW